MLSFFSHLSEIKGYFHVPALRLRSPFPITNKEHYWCARRCFTLVNHQGWAQIGPTLETSGLQLGMT